MHWGLWEEGGLRGNKKCGGALVLYQSTEPHYHFKDIKNKLYDASGHPYNDNIKKVKVCIVKCKNK